MKQFYLAEIVTKDKLIHQGMFFPTSRKAMRGKQTKAILYVHGLTGTFYGSVKLLEAFAAGCGKSGFGFAAFNNRGHDMITGMRKLNPKAAKGYDHCMGGAGYEKFEESVYDIDAGVSFLCNQGFTEIILCGHSTGANKSCYYAASKNDPRVIGIVLAGPLSDRLGLNEKELNIKRETMMQLLHKGKGDEPLFGFHFFPMTPRRFLSLFLQKSFEDTFDYGDNDPKLTAFSRIKKPILLVIGGSDEHLDRPVEKMLNVFTRHTRSKQFKSVIIPSALHSFNGKEKEVVSAITRWVKEI